MSATILKNSPTVRENVPSGHFERPFWKEKEEEKKGLLLPIFRKNRTLNMFFLIFGLIRQQGILNQRKEPIRNNSVQC